MSIKLTGKRRRPRALGRKEVMNPAKGLNTLVVDNLIDDKEASDLQNVQFVESGCPSKAFGYESTGSGLTNIPRGLGTLKTASVTELLTIDGTALMKWTGGSWSAVTGASFTSGQQPVFVQVRDAVYIHNGVDAAAKYDGTTLSRPTTTVSSAFGIFYQGYHFSSGVSAQPSRVYVSVSTDAADFTNANPTGTGEYSVYDVTTHPGASTFAGTGAAYFDIDKGDGDKITGFASFQDVLIVFKERSIYQITLDSSAQPVVERVNRSIGCVSHRSIAYVENDLFFLSRKGVYVLGNEPNYTTLIRSNELSSRIKPTLDTITEANLSKVNAFYNDNIFYCAIPSGGTSTINKLITYDRRYLGWSVQEHIQPNAITTYINSSNEQDLYFASDTEAKVHKMNTDYSANGVAYEAYWVSKAHDAGLPEVQKRWIDITLLFRSINGSVTVDIYGDNNALLKSRTISTNASTGSLSGIGTDEIGGFMFGESSGSTEYTGVSSTNVPFRIRLSTTQRIIKFKVSNANLNESFTLQGYFFAYRPYSHYKFPSAQKLY